MRNYLIISPHSRSLTSCSSNQTFILREAYWPLKQALRNAAEKVESSTVRCACRTEFRFDLFRWDGSQSIVAARRGFQAYDQPTDRGTGGQHESHLAPTLVLRSAGRESSVVIDLYHRHASQIFECGHCVPLSS